MRKKYMVLTSVIVSVLLSLSLVGVTQTYTPTPAVGVTQTYTPGGVYNPDADINKDGIVSIIDLVALGMAWYTTGTPRYYPELIRFFYPNETKLECPAGGLVWVTTPTFTWTPRNGSNNLILSIYMWFEARTFPNQTGNYLLVEFLWSITRYGGCLITDFTIAWGSETYAVFSAARCPFTFPGSPEIPHDLAEYTFAIHIVAKADYPGQPGQAFTAYIRNINLVLTVADGVPASNP